MRQSVTDRDDHQTTMQSFHIDYDEEGDILELRWGTARGAGRTGFELNENIILFTNSDLTLPLGLTLLSYQRLGEQSRLDLAKMQALPPDIQDSLRTLLQRDPLQRILRFQNGSLSMRRGRIVLTSRGPLLTTDPRADVKTVSTSVSQ